MRPPLEPGFFDALAALSTSLDDTGAPSMIIGGVAVIALGVPPLTIDIDATVAAATVTVERIADALASHDIGARIPDAVAFAREHHVYLGVRAAFSSV